LKQWLSDYASVRAVVTLPDKIFGAKAAAKSIFVLQKQADQQGETFVYPLTDLQDREVLKAFMVEVDNWLAR
jgi:site-specific DNA-methyltransferase (adenine-specific)